MVVESGLGPPECDAFPPFFQTTYIYIHIHPCCTHHLHPCIMLYTQTIYIRVSCCTPHTSVYHVVHTTYIRVSCCTHTYIRVSCCTQHLHPCIMLYTPPTSIYHNPASKILHKFVFKFFKTLQVTSLLLHLDVYSQAETPGHLSPQKNFMFRRNFRFNFLPFIRRQNLTFGKKENLFKMADEKVD